MKRLDSPVQPIRVLIADPWLSLPRTIWKFSVTSEVGLSLSMAASCLQRGIRETTRTCFRKKVDRFVVVVTRPRSLSSDFYSCIGGQR